MLFYIDESVVNSAEDGDTVVLSRLEDLYHCWSKGLCLIGSSRKNFLKISEIKGLDYYKLVEKTVQGIQPLYESLDFFVVLIHKNKKGQSLNQYKYKIREIDIESRNGIFDISLNFLVCENVLDYDFYKWITEQYIYEESNFQFHLNLLPFNGGGDTTLESLKHIQKHFCLVICDSDIKYEGAQEGCTCKKVRSYIDSLYTYGVKGVWMYTLTVHEVENLIPLDILQRISNKNEVKKLREILSKGYGETFLSFFDFKEGFKESTYRRIKKENIDVFLKYKELFLSLGKNEKSLKRILKQNYRKGQDKCIIQGVGNSVLANTIRYLMNNYIGKCDYTLSHYQINDWDKISRMVWSLGCAIKPKFV